MTDQKMEAVATVEPSETVAAVDSTVFEGTRGVEVLPEGFTKCVGCCALSINPEDMVGGRSDSQCCCFRDQSDCLRATCDGEKICCILQQTRCDMTSDCDCRYHEQFFCLECVMGCCKPAESAYVTRGTLLIDTEDPVTDEDVRPCNGCCCYYDSCLCSMPECLTCYRKDKAFCLILECITMPHCCSFCPETKQENVLMSSKGLFHMTNFKHCKWGRKVIYRRLCLDYRCAFPCDHEVPCVCFCLPWNVCCLKGTCACGCCSSLADLKRQINYPTDADRKLQEMGGAAPASVVGTQPGAPQMQQPPPQEQQPMMVATTTAVPAPQTEQQVAKGAPSAPTQDQA